SKKVLNIMSDIITNKVNQILEKINTHPVYTIEELLHGKKVKPELIHIIGGPSKALASILEKRFNLPVYYPKDYSISNAIGAALAKPTMEINMIADTERKILSVPELEIYDKIPSNFNLNDAKEKALDLINEAGKKLDDT